MLLAPTWGGRRCFWSASKITGDRLAHTYDTGQIARRFAVRASEGTHRDEQLRLMPQPVHRYEDAKRGLADGAIFGFGSGTNPNCLLLIELRTDSASPPSWQYGFVGMSAESLRANLDDREAWFFPAAGKIGAIDSWIWFFESPGMED